MPVTRVSEDPFPPFCSQSSFPKSKARSFFLNTMGKKSDEKQTAYVFVIDPEFGWRPAVLEDTKGDTAIVSIPEYKDEQSMTCDGGRAAKKGEQVQIDLKKYPHKVLPLQNVDHNGNLQEYPDMVRLPYLHEVRDRIVQCKTVDDQDLCN